MPGDREYRSSTGAHKSEELTIGAPGGRGTANGSWGDIIATNIARLSDHDWRVRWHACENLGAIGHIAASAAAAKALGDPDKDVRLAAAKCLGVMGSPSIP